MVSKGDIPNAESIRIKLEKELKREVLLISVITNLNLDILKSKMAQILNLL